MTIAPGTTLGEDGRYRLDFLVGTGGMAAVWLARDLRLDRDVAVKVLSDVLALDAEFVARFEREARLAAWLVHPNLVGVFDFAADGPRPYLVMEYVAGGSLLQRLRGPAGYAPPDPAVVARELLDALACVHGAGVVHRDVKPANILLDRDGRARLTDFGIAQRSGAAGLTGAGFVLGTRQYSAPEILRGLPATERSDLYSLGVVLGECLTSHGPPAVRALVAALTQEDPADRPTSATAATAILDDTALLGDPAPRLQAPDAPRPPAYGSPMTLLMPTVALEAAVPAPAPDAVTPRPPARPRRRLAEVLEARADRRRHERLLGGGGRRPAPAAAAALALTATALLFTAGAGTPAEADPAPAAQVQTTADVPSRNAPLARHLDGLDAAIDRARR